MRPLSILRFFCGVIVVACAAVSPGQVVSFTSFQPGYSFDSSAQGVAAIGPTHPAPITVAYQFTAGVSGVLHSIKVPHRWNSGHMGVAWSLWTDSGSDTLGSNMVTWAYSDVNSSFHIDTLGNSFPVNVLYAGSKYWLQLSTFGDGVRLWGKSSIGGLMYSGFMANNDNNWHYGNADVFPAYEVNVNAVPEPITLAAVAMGLVFSQRRRKN